MHVICTFRFLCHHASEHNAHHVVQKQTLQHCAQTFRQSLQYLRIAPSLPPSLLRRPCSKVKVISQQSFTRLSCWGDASLDQIVVTEATGCCWSKPQGQPALLTRCEGVCSTLSRPWQPKQSKSSSFMIMNWTAGTDLRCLAEPHHQ